MKEKELISKWLDYDLTDIELKAFKKLDAFNSFEKISESAAYFKAPERNTAAGYEKISSQISEQKNRKVIPLWKSLSAVAAIAAVIVSVYITLFAPTTETYFAENAERVEFLLPDTSEVILNAGSVISFEKDTWQENRSLTLEGEAYFNVASGKQFSVQTNQGEVIVLGTQFNVKDRADYFEVICFEGLVSVIFKNETIKLPAGQAFSVYMGEQMNNNIIIMQPHWLSQKTNFESVSVGIVLDEIERQFDVEIILDGVNRETIYTGTISHKSLEEALQAVTIPLGLDVAISEKTVTLKK